MSNNDINRLFWLAYCSIVKKEVGDLGPSQAIFFATDSQRAPPVECPPAYTDYGIFNLANNPLRSDSLFYSPQATNGYVDALLNYLSWVDIGGDNSDRGLLTVIAAKKNMDAATVNLDRETGGAFIQFEKLSKMGLVPPGMDLARWIVMNAPAVRYAEQELDQAAAKYKMANANMAGPMSGQWSRQIDLLNLVKKMVGPLIGGLNMAVTSAAPPSIADIFNAEQTGKPLPMPAGVYNVPNYGCPDYPLTVKSWQANATQPPAKTKSAQLDLSSAKSVTDTSFGQQSVSGSVSTGFSSIFKFGIKGAVGNTEQSLQSSFSEQNVSITMFWDDMKKVTLEPGMWNVSDPKATYPKLKPKAPDSVKILVRPAQLLLVNKLGYSITMLGSLKTEFEQKFSSTKEAGGYIKVFGFNVSIGGGGTPTTSSSTHTGTWNSTSSTFTVAPSPTAGYANVIAVIGEKIQTF